MQMVYNVKTLIYAIFLDASSLMYIFFIWVYQYVPNTIVDALGDSHLQNAFKGGSAIAIFILLFIARCYDVASRKRKFESDIADKSYFDAFIIAGNTLRDGKHYESSIISFTKALDLNFDNDLAQSKINEVKHLMEIGK